MRNKLISLVLILSLVFTGAFPMMVFAEEAAEAPGQAAPAVAAPGPDEVKEAMKIVTDAITEMKDVFPSSDYAEEIMKTFSEVSSYFHSAASVMGAINGCVSFLKLIGVIQDPTAVALANITQQLVTMNQRMMEMDQKLDRITDEMTKFQAHSEFNVRTDRAITYHRIWTEFRRDYMEKSLDGLMTDYQSMVRDGLKAWCQNRTDNARFDEDVDNTRIILLYENTEDGYELRFSMDNEVPEEYLSGGRYLILPEEILPETVTWDVNKYRDAFTEYVSGKIREKRDAGEWDAFECGNFPAFTEEGAAELTDELADAVAEEALNTLTYRVASIEVNRSSSFPANVLAAFELYCRHLNAADDGINAACKALFFTHAFEYEISDQYRELCNQMILQTGVYGSFVMDVIGMSRSVKDSEKEAFMKTYCDALDALDDVKTSGITGHPRFCYLTGTEAILGEFRLESDASIHTSRGQGMKNYESCYSSGTKITARTYGDKTPTDAPMVGDSNMQLISYTLRSNGVNPTFEYLNEHLKDRSSALNYGWLVTSLQPEVFMPVDTPVLLEASNVYGDYFPDGAVINPASLPGDAESQYIQDARYIRGGIFDYSRSDVASNQIVNVVAIYGETHTLWFTDECAFLGGPSRGMVGSTWPFMHAVEEVYAGNAPLGNFKYYDFLYKSLMTCNTIYLVPLPDSVFTGGDHNPLKSYLKESEEIRKNNRSGLFEDVKGSDWFFDAVEWAVQAGITTGTDETHFTPAGMCTRGQTVTFLWRADGQPAAEEGPSFSDVEDGAYYADAVKWAASKGIVNGRSESVFDPGGLITREELAAILCRYTKSRGEDTSAPDRITKFSDADRIGSWAADALNWCVEKGIVEGMGGDRIEPKGNATRAQIVTMLNRYLAKPA